MENFCEKKKLVLRDIEEVLREMNLGITYKSDGEKLLDIFTHIAFAENHMTILCSLKEDSDYLNMVAGFHPAAPLKRIGAVNKILKLYNRGPSASGISFPPFYIPPQENGRVYSRHSLNVRYEGLGVPKDIFKRMIEELIIGGYYFYPFVMKVFKNNLSAKKAFSEFVMHVKKEEENAKNSPPQIVGSFCAITEQGVGALKLMFDKYQAVSVK